MPLSYALRHYYTRVVGRPHESMRGLRQVRVLLHHQERHALPAKLLGNDAADAPVPADDEVAIQITEHTVSPALAPSIVQLAFDEQRHERGQGVEDGADARHGEQRLLDLVSSLPDGATFASLGELLRALGLPMEGRPA